MPNPFLPGRNTPSLTAVVFLLLVSTILAMLRLPTANALPAPYELTNQQIADFRRDGVIVIRGMLEGEALENAVKATNKIQRSRGLAQRLAHKIFPVYRNLGFQAYRKHDALKAVAFGSTAPTICAKLMGLDDEYGEGNQDISTQKPRSLRLLKEAILGFSRGDIGCGWHVDDKTFWPCEDSHGDYHPHKKKSRHQSDAGINVWISLSTVTAEEGGGLAVAPGSHNLNGKGRAGKILRRARQAIASLGPQTTCALAKLEPTCHDYMEKMKRVYDLQPGDAIIHDRYLFHRSDHFREGLGGDTKQVTKQRISLRYMPSDATYFNDGRGLDAATIHKNLQTGDPLWKGGEYFPQAWPFEMENEARAAPKPDSTVFNTQFLVGFGKALLFRKTKKTKDE